MNPLESLGHHVEELQKSLMNPDWVVGSPGGLGLTQFVLWLIVIFALVLVIVLIASKKLQIVPEGKFANMVEYGYQFVSRDIAESAIGHGYKKHLPFLATLFFFILIANFVGLIPGGRTPTGSISITWALSLIAFVYFNYYGFKVLGIGGYIKSLVPSGLPAPMVPFIWLLEFISLVIRALTLAVRLYGNMFAGHMVLGIFALATSVFLQSAIAGAGPLVALPSVGWFALLVAMYALEVLVAFLQAYVFTVLSAVYIGLATSSH